MSIELPLIELPEDFPSPLEALVEPNGLLGFGYLLSNELLIKAYYEGIFPWYNPSEPVFWWSPDPRAAFFTNQISPSKSMLKVLRKKEFTISINQRFDQVIEACAEPVENRPSTWISAEMIHAYQQLHRAGYAHSIEVSQQDQLVGGLYGISLGKLFFGESMFHRAPNASKVALHYLVKWCNEHDFPFIDCQMPNSHLLSLGAKEVSRAEFLSYLYQYRDEKVPREMWQAQDITERYQF
ncbi:MAG: leucyl/phenylalanyl-tRNA--protein transferase [Gammaproteobacteria bacterium]|nr:leucyl/phenylalanyl-tRNA--protein transferase [Gammaproteobacteria bacterium]